MSTKPWLASSIAFLIMSEGVEPPSMVELPTALIMGRTPSFS